MTFSTTVPNANQSPGLFPAQANVNFSRLKALINADHNFTDTAINGQGIHNQVSFINRSTPGSLPAGTSSILYSALDAAANPQLNFYNGSENFQVTPGVRLTTKDQTFNNGTPVTILSDPGYNYSAILNVLKPGSSLINVYSIFYYGSTGYINRISTASSGIGLITVDFNSGNLRVTNTDSNQTFVTCLNYTRI